MTGAWHRYIYIYRGHLCRVLLHFFGIEQPNIFGAKRKSFRNCCDWSGCIFQFQLGQLSPSAYLYVREGHGDDKVAGPVAAAGESHGCRSRPLAEQFGHYEPRYRTRTDLEEAHKEEDSRHADVAHPGEVGLQETGTISREVGGDGWLILWTTK